VRVLAGQVPRAGRRITLVRRVGSRVQLGAEWNPGESEVGPLANVLLLPEGRLWPALIAGTSSDRIGTPEGRAYFLTASKSLDELLGLPLAPYVGISYGTFEDRARPIGGLEIPLGDASLGVMHDGVHWHPSVSADLGKGFRVTVLAVDRRDPGVSVSWAGSGR
jgi:hypothetical protein